MKQFNGTRRAPFETRSLKVTAEMKKGQAVGHAAGDETTAALGAGRNFVGFLDKEVTTAGVTTAYHFPGLSENYFEIPAKVNDFVDVSSWEEFEAEAPLITITGGTGALNAASNEALLELHTDGKWRVAQAGGTAIAKLVRKDLTVQDATITNNVRVLIQMLKQGIEVV
jgi:hypothetical protein